jgi:hypothetical protein
MPAVDFSAVKARVSMDDVLRLIGWKANFTEPSGLRGNCPLCGAGKKNSRSFAVCDKGFSCFSCLAKGDQLRLYSCVMKLTVFQAAHELCGLLGVDVPVQGRTQRPAETPRNGEEER